MWIIQKNIVAYRHIKKLRVKGGGEIVETENIFTKILFKG